MPTTDQELTDRFIRSQSAVETTDVMSRVKRATRRVKVRRKLGVVALVVVVVVGTTGSLLALDKAFRGTHLPADQSPIPSITVSPDKPTASPSGDDAEIGTDIGLAFDVCQGTRLEGLDLVPDDVADTAWTGYRANDAGRCSLSANIDRWLVAVDYTGDGRADLWGPLPMTNCPNVGCQPLGATDLDADGKDELIVMTTAAVIDHMFFSVQHTDGGHVIEPIVVAAPGHLAAGIAPGAPLVTAAAGDEGFSAWIRCEDYPAAPILVYTWKNSQVESNDPVEWHETMLQLLSDGMFHVIGATDLTLPQGQDPGFVLSQAPACGVDFNRWAPPNL
jgi:hypothetical protein